MRAECLLRAINAVVEPAVRVGLGNTVAGPGVFVIETIAQRTGQTRRVPLLGVRLGNRLVVCTIRRRSQWASNLEHRPHGGVWIAGGRHHSTADVTRLAGTTIARLSIEPAEQPSTVVCRGERPASIPPLRCGANPRCPDRTMQGATNDFR